MTTPRLVVARAPLRVSFCGGGSDLPPPTGTVGQCGAVVSSTIDKYVYCVARPRDDSRFYLSWSRKEIVERPDLFEHSIVRAAFADLAADGAEFPRGVELSFLADVPGTGSGLGSSAATAAACLLALDALAGGDRYDGIHGRRALAERSIAIQPGTVRGKQDEYATVYGGLNAMRFTNESAQYLSCDAQGNPGRSWVEVNAELSVDLSPLGEEDPSAAAWLQERFALFRPPDGATRSAAEVLATYDKTKDEGFRSHCIEIAETFKHGMETRQFVCCAAAVLDHNDGKEAAFGGYMTPELEAARSAVWNAGASCSKLCGAGGTGHLLVGFEPERRAEVVKAAEKAWGRELPFRFSRQGAGVVYTERE